MIQEFNRKQLWRAVFAVAVGIVATGLTFAFFWFGLWYFSLAFGLEKWRPWIPVISFVGVAVAFYSGWRHWRMGIEGQDGFLESSFAGGFDGSTAGGTWANYQTMELRGLSYFVTGIALGGPLQLFKAYDRLRSRIDETPGLEARLAELLGEINAEGKWHSMSKYRSREIEVMYLIRMGLVEFSPRRGSLRGKGG